MTKAERVAKVVKAAAGAYSEDRYTQTGWIGVARKLIEAGFTDEQAEAVLRSKHMRWAGDAANRNGFVTTADFMRYVTSNYGGLNTPKFAASLEELRTIPVAARPNQPSIAAMVICAGDANVAALIELAIEIRSASQAPEADAALALDALSERAAKILTSLERRSRG